MLSIALGVIGLGAVLCFHHPALLTTPEARGLYPIPYVRALLHVVLVGSFVLGAGSVCLRQRKALGLTGMALTLVAAVLGGSRVPIDGELRDGPFLGLDWFLLNVMAYSAVFIPLERLFARRPDQPVFRRGWRTDLYVPIYVLGFAEAPLFAYVAFVSIQATFIHSNLRFAFGPLRWLLATPQFHHWHHAADREAVDKNFAVHLPVLDRLFGTYYQPEGRWPKSYGLAGGAAMPEGYLRQLVHPLRKAAS